MRAHLPSILLAGGLVLAAALPSRAVEYNVVKQQALGGEGGWDYLKVDEEARRLYISRGTKVVVVDADTLGPAGEIPDTPGVHGIAIDREHGLGFTSNGRDDSVTVFELATLKSVGRVKTGANPDAILFDPFTRRVYAFNGRSGDVTVIDTATRAAVGTVPVGGKLEFGATDGAGRIFVNVEDKNQIAAIDAKALKVLARWPLAGCEEPSGLAIDAPHHRLFSVCGNKHMVVVDDRDGRLVATLPIGEGPDAAAFDPDGQLAFSSNGDGTLTVVHESSPDAFEVVQTVKTQPSARTMALDPRTHNIYLVAARFGERPPATPEMPRPRPPVLPGSFTVLVVGR